VLIRAALPQVAAATPIAAGAVRYAVWEIDRGLMRTADGVVRFERAMIRTAPRR
jgi:hypothetical protein